MEGLQKKKRAQRYPRASNKLFKERDEGNALVHRIQTLQEKASQLFKAQTSFKKSWL